jgi:predicted nucleotidyltransferase
MYLLPDQLMFGVAPALLIDCARQIHDWDVDCSFTIEKFSEALGAPVSESAPVLKAMMETGLFRSAADKDSYFITEQKLGQLALAKISRGISRTEARRLLDKIIEKAAWVNAHSDAFGHNIECVVVFGSYLTEKPHLGDLDIGVSLNELRGQFTQGDGESFYDSFRRVMAARHRTLRAIRLRQPKKISIHDLDEVIRLETPYKVVFGTLPEGVSEQCRSG